MSDDIAVQISKIEDEILALTANQPPNPYSIVTFKVTRVTAVNDEVKTIVWDDGIPGFISVYVTSGSANAPVLVDAGQLKIFVSGNAGITYVAIALRGFSLV